VAVKNVTINEPFFRGHFPGKPIMPGVLICEAMAQVGAILAHQFLDFPAEGKVAVLTGLDGVKFKKPVVPGDQLRLELTCIRYRSPMWKMKGVATVDGKVVTVAEISAMEVQMSGIRFR
jgi:beta-hydroxyacyl-ACP dehydratase FabZ